MCGIWGIADLNCKIDNKTLIKVIKKLIVLSEARGKEASGISILKGQELSTLRKAKVSHELLRDEDFKKVIHKKIIADSSDDVFIIGHSRMVTNGSQYQPENNQPVSKKYSIGTQWYYSEL
jgi:glutamine phosphoribosylpyrophosphate amidotransferase